MSKDKCNKCNVKIKESNKELICCGICGDGNHIKCIPTDAQFLTAVVSDPNLFWLGNSCVKDIKEGFKKICDLQKSQNEIVFNQDKLSDELSSFRRELALIDANLSKMANKIVEFDKSVTNVNTQIKDVEGGLKKNWTGDVKGTIKEEVKSTTLALNNVVKSIKNNVETINLITNDEIKESDIKKMYRIGKKGDNPRPMMKQLSDELKNVSISHDFTKKQREKCKKLVAEAKDKQKQESGEFLYRHTSSDCASLVFNSSGNVNKIKVGLLNIRSLGPNVDDVHGLLNDGLDVLMLTETWHKSSENICLSLAKPRDFSFLEQVRLNDPGHGEDILVHPSGIYSDHGLVTGQFLINPTPVIFKKS
ncbi:hypothetical protein HELRODRAFT_174234 [Helobdella robusta]|uniref:Endonuclease/exonuclease/phosphatase domain-containing protein n=1 Tax=Helobdella robusta TaxID=6412 RepID=T1F7U5_HELRO|nr:hypothetical protein HELRODRAFT_174234 [Helobdella robusta]ESO02811.1 hypothetical protein HELRODRAFT_174234 [Helobdella robusta]